MKQVKITDEDLITARKMATDMGVLNESITRGAGSVAGFLGEIVTLKVLDELGVEATQDNTYNYDIVTKDGLKIDVKTKRTSVKPKPHYGCSVTKATMNRQKCDVYAFVRVKNDYSVAWFLGFMSKKDYLDKSKLLKKGTLDPDNNYVVKADCYNISIDQLEDNLDGCTEA